MQHAFGQFLKEAHATANGTLNALIGDEITASPAMRSSAGTSSGALREFVRTESDRDAAFPAVLTGEDFVGGSFARETKIWPLDDIDLYVPLDGTGLNYFQQGQRLPYTVVGNRAGLYNPLLAPRWAMASYISSSLLVSGFSSVLARRYTKSEVRPDGQAINVRFTIGETEQADGLGFDVVPCFLLSPERANEHAFYLIPDGAGGWIRTNPRLDTALVELAQERSGDLYRPVARLIKYWNRRILGGRLPSYYIEVAILRSFLRLHAINQSIPDLLSGLVIGFEAVAAAVARGPLQPFLAGAPDIQSSGRLLAFDASQAKASAAAAALALAYRGQGREDLAVGMIKKLFGITT